MEKFLDFICCVRNDLYKCSDDTLLLPKEEEYRFRVNKEIPYISFAYGLLPPMNNTDVPYERPWAHHKRLPSPLLSTGIKKVCCGQEHVLLLTNANLLMTCGNN